MLVKEGERCRGAAPPLPLTPSRPPQLLPDQHGRPHHPGVRRQGDPDLRPRRGARAHAEAAGPRQQVRLWALGGPGAGPAVVSADASSGRTPWKRCCFSGDGEYIVAGSARQHALYIWEKSIGNLVKILHGTRGELLLDVAVTQPAPLFDGAVLTLVLSVWPTPLPSGIPCVPSSPPSPAGLCPSGPRTKW